MGDVHFDPGFSLKASPFVAAGTIDTQYKAVSMYVGIVQLKGTNSDDIIGAAFGMGAAATVSNGDGTDRWTMVLQHDTLEGRKLRNGPAIGFVLVEMPGGKFTGWIDHNITLYGGDDPAPADGTNGALEAFLASLSEADRTELARRAVAAMTGSVA